MSPITLILIAGGGVAFLLLIAGIVITATSEHSLVEERLGRYLDEEVKTAKPKGERSTPVADWLNVWMEKSKWGDGISRDLARADLKLRAGEYMVVMIIAGLGVGVVAWYIGGRSMIFALLGALFGT